MMAPSEAVAGLLVYVAEEERAAYEAVFGYMSSVLRTGASGASGNVLKAYYDVLSTVSAGVFLLGIDNPLIRVFFIFSSYPFMQACRCHGLPDCCGWQHCSATVSNRKVQTFVVSVATLGLHELVQARCRPLPFQCQQVQQPIVQQQCWLCAARWRLAPLFTACLQWCQILQVVAMHSILPWACHALVIVCIACLWGLLLCYGCCFGFGVHHSLDGCGCFLDSPDASRPVEGKWMRVDAWIGNEWNNNWMCDMINCAPAAWVAMTGARPLLQTSMEQAEATYVMM